MIIKQFIVRYSSLFCLLGGFAAKMVSSGCRYIWYQPEEPESLSTLVNAGRNQRKGTLK